MRTPAQLRKEAARARLRAELLAKQREDELRLAEILEREAGEREKGLRPSKQEVTVSDVFTDPVAHAIASSKGKNPDDALLLKARVAKPKPFTMRSLARHPDVRMSITAISLARSGKKPIRRWRAEAIERLTGFAATAENWPGGIID